MAVGVLITGGRTGIGRAAALLFAERGDEAGFITGGVYPVDGGMAVL